MVQAAEPRPGCNSPVRVRVGQRHSTLGRFFSESEVSAVVVIVTDVLIHEPLQMTLIEHDHMVEKFSSEVAHEAFDHAILPRASDRNSNRGDAQTLCRFQNLAMKCVLTVENEKLRRGVVGESLSELL